MRWAELWRVARVVGALAAAVVVASHSMGVAAGEEVPRLVTVWGQKGSGEGEFDVPIGIAVNGRGEVFVTDFKNERVEHFGGDGRFLGAFGVRGNPSGIASDGKGRLFVAQFKADCIAQYTEDGKLVGEWGKTGDGDGEFKQPAGLAVGPGGCVYLGDDVNRRVQKFSRDGRFLAKWGGPGGGPGQFGGEGAEKLPAGFRTSGPNFLAFNSKGELYVSEGHSGRIQVFTGEGKFLRLWGSNAPGPGSFGGRPTLPGPTGICIDGQDRVWVASTNNRIQHFTGTGELLGGFGTKGSAPGEFNTPHGLAMDSKGNLYVVDTRNNRVQKFATQGR